MKKLSPIDWVKLSKQGLGLSDVITMAYVNERSMDFHIDEPEDMDGSSDALDALRYSLQTILATPKGSRITMIGTPYSENDFFNETPKQDNSTFVTITLPPSKPGTVFNVYRDPNSPPILIGGGGGLGRNNPVYNNTLEDFNKKVQMDDYGPGYRLIKKECECGAMKTYGKDCKRSFHSDWCPLK